MAPKRNRPRTMSPIVSSRPIAREVITYSVDISDPFHRQEFNFSHRLPPALQIDASPLTNRPALLEFMDQVVHEHHRELLEAYPWKCKCGLPATTLVHHPVSLLHLDGEPLVRNHPEPVCVEGTPCWQRIVRCVHGAMNDLSAMFAGSSMDFYVDSFMPERTSLKRCGYCAKADTNDGDSLKMCGTCKAVRYCSRECQVADWPNHKKVCRHIAARNNN